MPMEPSSNSDDDIISYHELNEGDIVSIRRVDRKKSLKVRVYEIHVNTIWLQVIGISEPAIGIVVTKKDNKLVDDSGKELLIINRGT